LNYVQLFQCHKIFLSFQRFFLMLLNRKEAQGAMSGEQESCLVYEVIGKSCGYFMFLF
jgi:hypothetical protein